MSKPVNYCIIYHGDGVDLWNAPEGAYRKIVDFFKKNLHSYGIELIHLSPEGHDGWGDINIHYPGDIKEAMWNREVFFTRFLEEEAKDGELYWFGEPDILINEMFPPTKCDLALLDRHWDGVKINPSWRLARKSALPFFKDILDNYLLEKKEWHGDSNAFAAVGKKLEKLGKLKLGRVEHYGISIEFRDYNQYVPPNGKYLRHYKYTDKNRLLRYINEQK